VQATHILVPLVAPRSNICASSPGSQSDLPVYFSQFYVKQNSAYYSVGDLEGSRFAYNDDTSLSGYHCARFFLRSYLQTAAHTERQQLNISDLYNQVPFFSGSMATGSHRNSILAVLADQADVVCLDCNVVAMLQTTSSGRSLLAQLRSIKAPHTTYPIPLSHRSRDQSNESSAFENGDVDTVFSCADEAAGEQQQMVVHVVSTTDGFLGPNPSQPVVVSTRLPDVLRRRIQEAFLKVPAAALDRLMASHYVTVDTSHYKSIAHMLHDCKDVLFFGPDIDKVLHDESMHGVVNEDRGGNSRERSSSMEQQGNL
jgi:ABC-type phosphate/phosphonate transport system substrate-binding protein